jgi:hypothetical protein
MLVVPNFEKKNAMHKTVRQVGLAGLYIGLIVVASCSKAKIANPLNCSNDAERVSASATTYAQSPTKANCEAYKKTVSDFYKSCSSFYTGASKKALDDFLAEPCPN